jgi:hypothetical protein
MTTIRVFLLGVREWESCAVHGVGMSYDNPSLSEAYDRGVNVGVLGHNIATAVKRALCAPFRALTAEREVRS